jgi:hypothetical protein
VAIPTEHGGWSLTAEPAVLGLLVAWSPAGLALAGAAMVAFVARTPLKLALVDRYRHRRLPRSALATRIATVEILVLVALVVVAVVSAQRPFWAPLALAAPLIAIELWYDMRSRSRRLVPELAGTVGIGAVAAAIALAGETSALVATGLWCVVTARSVAAVPHVRAQVVRTRRATAATRAVVPSWPNDVAQLVALGAVIVAWSGGAVPVAAVVVMGVMALIHLMTLRMAPMPVAAIGVLQIGLGLAVVLTTGLAVAASPS